MFERRGGGLLEGELPSGETYGYLRPSAEVGLASPAAYRAIFLGLKTVADGARHLIADAYGLPFRTASIGAATGRALNQLGIFPAASPRVSTAEGLTETLLPFARHADGRAARFLLVRAEEARDVLPDALREAGAEVTIAPAYRTVTPAGALDALRELFRAAETVPDAITFTSSSTARNLFTLFEVAGIELHAQLLSIGVYGKPDGGWYDQATMSRVPAFASIGPITSATIKEFHYPVAMEASEANVAVLARELVAYLDADTAGGGPVD